MCVCGRWWKGGQLGETAGNPGAHREEEGPMVGKEGPESLPQARASCYLCLSLFLCANSDDGPRSCFYSQRGLTGGYAVGMERNQTLRNQRLQCQMG